MGEPDDPADGTDVDTALVEQVPVESREARPPPPPPPLRGRGTRSIPPPIPDRRKRPTTIGAIVPPPVPTGDALETPTVLDRAIAAAVADTPAERARRLSAGTSSSGGPDSAALAYELGELCERQLADDERAIAAYRRADELEPGFAPAAWGLRRVLARRRKWPELLAAIDRELARAPSVEARTELRVEKARVLALRGGGEAEARAVLEAAIAEAPADQAALLELERVVAKRGDAAALRDVYLRAAEAVTQPERKIAYWADAAHLADAASVERVLAALDDAARVAAGAKLAPWAGERIARERLRLIEMFGPGERLGEAMDALAAALLPSVSMDPARRRELVALRRRQAQHVRAMPINAWDYLQQARELAPAEPVILVELAELAGELGRGRELDELVRAASGDGGPAALIALWTAEAHLVPERRAAFRALLKALELRAPGSLLLLSAAECEGLAGATREAARGELAQAYLAAASTSVEPAAAAALYVQAAELFAYYTRGGFAAARDALARALELQPESPAVLEAWIELADASGDAGEAIAKLRALAIAARGDRGAIERALRVARKHGRMDAVLELERDLVTLVPDDVALAWRLEAALAEVGHDAERCELLAKLATIDPDPGRKQTALLWAARLHERMGADDAAIRTYRELLALQPGDRHVRDALIALLRTRGLWDELVVERRAEAREVEPAVARRAWREAAWVLEVVSDDVAQAGEVYAEWWAKLPQDRTALEGVARCRALLRDHAGEVAARAAIAELDQTTEARWLHARSLERAGQLAPAAEVYRRVLADEDAPVASTSAALALAAIATRLGDTAMRLEAAEALATRTTDARLAGALLDACGWTLALADDERAAAMFERALARRPDQRGSLLGLALAAARRDDATRISAAYGELAAQAQAPAQAAALGMRAAMAAIAALDPARARARIEAAYKAAPDDAYAILAACETTAPTASADDDPFGPSEDAIIRAELLAKRAALAAGAARSTWELDRADLLEAAGQLREAGAAVAAVLRRDPDDRRALTALRRIARRGGDNVRWAQASFALARRSNAPANVVKLLRDAAEVYDAPGSRHAEYAAGIYRRIVTADPSAPELDRLLALLRERGDAQELVAALSQRLRALAADAAPPSELMAPLLYERAASLVALGRDAEAAVDLDALLEYASSHVEGLRLRAELAKRAGDVDRAVALWWRYLAVEPAAARREEIEGLLEKALASDEGVAPPPPAVAASDAAEAEHVVEIEAQDPDYTDVSTPLRAPAPTPTQQGVGVPRRQPAIIRRPSAQTPVAPPPVVLPEDEMGESTMRADLSALQEAERREAQMFESNTALTDLSELQEAERREATKSTSLSAQLAAASPFDEQTATSPRRGPAIIRRPASGPVPLARPSGVTESRELGLRKTEQAPVPARAARAATEGATDPSLEDFFDLGGDGDLDVVSATAESPNEILAPRRAAQIDVPKIDVSTSSIRAAVGAAPGETTRPRALTPPPLEPGDADAPAAEEPSVDADALSIAEERAGGPDDSAVVMLSYQELQPLLAGDAAIEAAYCEAELATAPAPPIVAALSVQAGRLAEATGNLEHARACYAAAVAADATCAAALASLRRLARGEGDLVELTRFLDAELALAAGAERDALARYRLDVLLARGERTGAAAVIDDVLAKSPGAAGALLVRLELALHADDGAVIDATLGALADALEDPELRAGIVAAQAARAGRGGVTSVAAIRQAAGEGEEEAAGAALLELAYHVEGEDPTTAAALAVRAQVWLQDADPTDTGRAAIAEAAQLAARIAARDPLVARVATESALVAADTAIAVHAFTRWVRGKAPAAERAYAAACAAELEPARFGRMWATVLELDPGDDYAIERMRAAHLTAGEVKAAVELDLQRALETGRDAPALAAVDELVAIGHLDDALDALARVRGGRPASAPITEALAEVYGRLGRWGDAARLLGELAAMPGLLAPGVIRRRSAQAWDRAVRAIPDTAPRTELEPAVMAALDAWDLVREADPTSPLAHASAITLASRLDDRDVLVEALTRAQAAETSPWAATSLALRRARLLLDADPRLALEVARDAGKGLDDPRRTLGVMLAAAYRRELGDAAGALEDRAAQLDAAGSGEAGMLRVRAAQLALDAGDAARATRLLGRVDATWPGVAELVDVARRRTGAPPAKTTSFVRALRDADAAAARGEPGAIGLYQRALELVPAEPLAAAPLVRLAIAQRQPAAIAKYALERVRAAQAEGAAAKVDAHELAALVETLRGDAARAHAAFELAAQAEPSRIDLAHRTERALAAGGKHRELLAVREREIAIVQAWLRAAAELDRRVDGAADLAPLLGDAAALAVLDKRPDTELARHYAAVLEAAPRHLPSLLRLEALARTTNPAALADLDARLAELAEEPRVRAALLVRAGEALAATGRPAEAVAELARAVDLDPASTAAGDAWLHLALLGQQWPEVARAAARQARHHLAGVVLMDKVNAPAPAIAALRLVLDAEPAHRDAFVRLRLLYERTTQRDELAALLRRRLDVERDPRAQIELHRSLAEHHADEGDRKTALQHYRTILTVDPADVRAHAAIADLVSEPASWQEAVAAVAARIPLERDARILGSLHYRLGAIYNEHDPAQALAAFREAARYRPDDEAVLLQITELAGRAGDWKLALEACERLVTNERDPEKLAVHLRRAAMIFAQGFNDRERTERMLSLALESAPTDPESLRLLVQFYRDAGDAPGLRLHISRLVGVLRARIANDPLDGAAYRALARACAARGEPAMLPAARAAAELALVLGSGGEPEQRLLALPAGTELAAPGADDRLVADLIAPELRTVFRALGDAIAKHVGVDLDAYGVSRRQRLRATEPAAVIAREVAATLGLGEVDVYISSRRANAMVAEPTSPVSLVLGAAIAAGDPREVRFAAGAALTLARMSLSIPARLPPDELDALVQVVLRVIRPDARPAGLDPISSQAEALRRHIPAGLLAELQAVARRVEPPAVDHVALAQALTIAGLRAGWAASGSVLPGLTILAGAVGTNVPGVLAHPIARGLISYALGEAATMERT